MKKLKQSLFNFYGLILFMVIVFSNSSYGWRSALYPSDWQPGFSDSAGRFLHDFSYAGYKSGLAPIPNVTGPIYNVTQAPYNADNTGANNARAGIQAAIDAAVSNGGGVVYLPAGTYKVERASVDDFSTLRVNGSNVVVRGDGPSTKILSVGQEMRNKTLFSIGGGGGWYPSTEIDVISVTQSTLSPTDQIKLASIGNYQVGDHIILRTNNTNAFKQDHNANNPDKWKNAKGIVLLRKIVAINSGTNTITIDAPTRYAMKTRDNFRIYRYGNIVRECAIENLAIGMEQITGSGFSDSDYSNSNKAAYRAHLMRGIFMSKCIDSWIRNVSTFKPSSNTGDFHIISQGITVTEARHITVIDCNIQKPQYEGGGGNGYLFAIRSQDSLYKENTANHGRHNFTFSTMRSSGNVLLRNLSTNPRLTCDFHSYFSPANLFDSMVLVKDRLEGYYRGFQSNGAAHTTTESVFWNTQCDDALSSDQICIRSQQWGYGYIIGTSGAESGVRLGTDGGTAPEDWAEGVGSGATLEPASLYEDQLAKRIARSGGFPTGVKKVINRNHGRELAVAADTQKNANIVAESASSAEDHLWKIVSAGTGGFVYLENKKSGYVMDVTGASMANDANVAQWAWNGGADHRRVKIIDAGGGYSKLQFKHSNKMLATIGTSEGTNVKQETDSSNTRLQWTIVDQGTGFSKFVNRASNRELAVAADTQKNGNVVAESVSTALDHKWNLIDVGGGFLRFENEKSGFVLDVSGASTANNANVAQWTWQSGADHRRLKPLDMGGGYYKFQFKHSGKMMSTVGTSNGTGVKQENDGSNTKLQWRLQ